MRPRVTRREQILVVVARHMPTGIAEDALALALGVSRGELSDELVAMVERDGLLSWRGLPNEDAPLVYRIAQPTKARGEALDKVLLAEIEATGDDGYALCDLALHLAQPEARLDRRLRRHGTVLVFCEQGHWYARSTSTFAGRSARKSGRRL